MTDSDKKLIETLKREVEEERERSESLKTSYENLKANFEDKLQAYNQIVIQKDELLTNLENDLMTKSSAAEDYKNTAAHYEKLFEEKKNEIKNLNDIVSNLESSVHSKTQEIRSLKSKVEEMEYRNAHAKRHIEECDASRISPHSFNFNDTEISKEDQLFSMLKKEVKSFHGQHSQGNSNHSSQPQS